MIKLIPMEQDEYEPFMALSMHTQAQDQVRAGRWKAEEAQANIFARYGVEELPVISRSEHPVLLGSVRQKDIIEVYNREIRKIDLAGSISNIARTTASRKTVKLAGDVHLHEVEIPRHLIGKTIRETDIRKRYQVEIVLIKRTAMVSSEPTSQTHIFPDPDYRFDSGDHLLVLGSDTALRKFQENRID